MFPLKFTGIFDLLFLRERRRKNPHSQIPGVFKACYSYKVAAEQKARTTYDNILRLSDDPDVNDVIKFLRQREIVHFQRFGEAIQLLREKLNPKNVYAINPAMDL